MEPFKKYTVCLQSERCTLSDFFGFWTFLRIITSKRSENIARNLIDEMKSREKVLLDNPVVISSIYLDPRYQRVLSNEQKALAVFYLKDLYQKIESIEHPRDSYAELPSPNQPLADFSDAMEAYFESIQNERHNTDRNEIVTDNAALTKIEELLNDFHRAKEDLRINVFDYWEKKKSSSPELYKLATTMNSIPPTQTTVERGFSALAIVLTSHRTRVSDDCLQDILINRTNFHCYQKVRKEIRSEEADIIHFP